MQHNVAVFVLPNLCILSMTVLVESGFHSCLRGRVEDDSGNDRVSLNNYFQSPGRAGREREKSTRLETLLYVETERRPG